jgi:thioredoxin reductase-like selenoprotein T
VSGGPHPAGPVKEVLAIVARIAQALTVIMVLFGSQIFSALRMPVPQWTRDLERNRAGALLGAFIVGNIVASNVYKSGAFEVYYDGQLVWSKLNSGQAPHLGAILSALAKAMRG